MIKSRFRLIIPLMLLLLAVPALAAGDPNIEGGGGGMGTGSSTCYWNGDDGVRITVATKDGGAVATFDWSNYDESGVMFHFGKRTKLDYRSGYSLQPFNAGASPYISRTPSTSLPRIVSTSGGNNIATIRKYFTSEGPLHNVAADARLEYEDLIGGDYKLLLEPMAYFYFGGVKYAATATEAALLDVKASGQVRYWLGRMTHQNLPLAMFLEHSDLGFAAWGGASSGRQSNLDIINYLGVGIVTFKPKPVEDPREFDYLFHCDTDVIISFPIYSSVEINPDDNAFVTLDVGDTKYHRQFICPAGGVQTIWVRWHTPKEPCELTMTATGAGSPVILHVKVVLLEEVLPPDPTFYDTNPGFSLISPPDTGTVTRTTWGEWFARWIQLHGEHLGGYDEDGEPWYYTCTGYCKEHGYWEFYYVSYEATLHCTFKLEPDGRCQTDYRSGRYGTVMASGYGVQAEVTTSITRGVGVDSYDVTPIQFVVATFPEFKYAEYNRLLEKTSGGKWQFKSNPHSLYGSCIHYTPLWYPDDTYYPVHFQAIDCWTPGGQLHVTGVEQLYIYQSCLDDWYIHNIK